MTIPFPSSTFATSSTLASGKIVPSMSRVGLMHCRVAASSSFPYAGLVVTFLIWEGMVNSFRKPLMAADHGHPDFLERVIFIFESSSHQVELSRERLRFHTSRPSSDLTQSSPDAARNIAISYMFD